MKIETGSFLDPIQGRSLKTVRIGDQIWMVENLNVSTYSNGDPIPNITNVKQWGRLTSGGWCYYENDPKYAEIYGKLYNWHAVNDPRGLAPEGWHIPSDEEWRELEMLLGMSDVEATDTGWRGEGIGSMLKEHGPSHWKAPNDKATNESGFTALPGGYRDVNGLFYVGGYSSYWWSSAEKDAYFSWYRSLYHSSTKVHRTTGYEGDGFSVRCLKDY